jgi:hypothetical protein
VSEIKVLRRIFASKMTKLSGIFRISYNVELCELYGARNIFGILKPVRRNLPEYVARVKERKNAFGALVGKSFGKILLRRQRWYDNI